MSFDSLKGKVIAVSGGRSGIGLAIAKKLLHHGAKVAIADISPNPPEELASIAEIDTDYIYTQADVSRRETVRQWVKLIGNKFGRLDGMIPNAGIAPDESRIEDNDTFEHVMAVNVLGVWNCGIESFLQFQDQGSGGVICITSSTQGLRGGKAIPAYTASKHAIIGLMRAWALDWADRGIRVNAVAPGMTETPLQKEKASEGLLEHYRSRIPMHREGQPEELADCYLFLLADTSSYMTGHTLVCDGGLVV